MALLKEQFTQLEIELVQLREQVNKQQPGSLKELLAGRIREQDNKLAVQLRNAQQERDDHERKLFDLTEGERHLQKRADPS